MAAEVGDTPVTIVDMVRVLKQICNEKRLELDQRVLDEPGLRNPISDLSRDALTAVIDLGDFILKSEGALAPTFETFEPSLKRKIPEITHLVGLLDYLPPGLADLIKRICSNAAKVVDFLEGLYEAHPLSSETSFNKPTERLEELSLRFRSLSTKAVKLEIELNLEAAAKAADEARDAADASKQAAGTAADATLGSYYEKIAIEEATSARNFRIGAIVCLIVGVGIAGWIAWVIISNHEEGAASQLFKILACLPVLGVAFYLSHESNSHRMVARRAKEVEVRLQTMEAFLAPLTPEQRGVLRAKVGESILSGPLSLSTGTDKQALDAQAIIEKLIDKA